MLKTRVIPTLLWRQHSLVKGVGFDSTRIVGTIIPAIRLFTMRNVDELVLLNVSATAQDQIPNLELIAQCAQECNVPLTVGGGIRSVSAIRDVLYSGADKVAIGTGCYEIEGLVEGGANRFGAQCIVASVDYKRHEDGSYECYSHCGSQPTGKEPVAWAKELEQRGAGEILLTSVDLDGTMDGYDLDLIRSVSEAVSIPVVASGGAGGYEDLYKAVTVGKASAVASASIYQFTQHTPREAKEYLAAKGIPIRQALLR